MWRFTVRLQLHSFTGLPLTRPVPPLSLSQLNGFGDAGGACSEVWSPECTHLVVRAKVLPAEPRGGYQRHVCPVV